MKKFDWENLSKKNKVKAIIICIIVVFSIVFFSLYRFNYRFRQGINNLITLKTATSESIPTIPIDQDNIDAVMGFGKYFAVLKQNNLVGYIGNEEEFVHGIVSTNPIYETEGEYLVIAEKGDSKVYLFKDKKLVYEKEVGGEVSTLAVNKNGYVAIGMNKNGYRSVIDLLDPEGEQIFTTYLATTYASIIKISPNNKRMVIVEVDTSGIKLSSNLKFVQIDKIKEKDESIVTVDKVESLISDVAFVNNNTVVYLTDNMVKQAALNGDKKDILDLSSTNITNVDIGLGNHIVRAEKSSNTIFNNSTDIVVVDRDNDEIGRYTIDGTVKELSVQNNIICASLGQQIYFLTSSARPIKKYSTSSDVKQVVMFNNGNMAALIYRNKIEIIYI